MTTAHESVEGLDAIIREKLLDEARDAARHAYAPYSRFRVGAAALGGRGSIYRGANIENASYGLGLCAERAALASALGAGEKNIVALAVACVDAPQTAPPELRMPCGACRQWLRELAPGAEVFILGVERSFRVEELLPMAFSLGEVV